MIVQDDHRTETMSDRGATDNEDAQTGAPKAEEGHSADGHAGTGHAATGHESMHGSGPT
jgi:hypothetical protein